MLASIAPALTAVSACGCGCTFDQEGRRQALQRQLLRRQQGMQSTLDVLLKKQRTMLEQVSKSSSLSVHQKGLMMEQLKQIVLQARERQVEMKEIAAKLERLSNGEDVEEGGSPTAAGTPTASGTIRNRSSVACGVVRLDIVCERQSRCSAAWWADGRTEKRMRGGARPRHSGASMMSATYRPCCVLCDGVILQAYQRKARQNWTE